MNSDELEKKLEEKVDSWGNSIVDSLHFLIDEMEKQRQQSQRLEEKVDALMQNLQNLATKEQVKELSENLQAMQDDLNLVEKVSYKTASEMAGLKLVK